MTMLKNWKIINDVDKYGKPYQKLVGVSCTRPGSMSSFVNSEIANIDWGKGIVVTQSGTVYELGVK